MWGRELFGTDLYHLVGAFIAYSILGWFVESVYMSFCNRRLTNRGFGKGPFCPIYGVGAVVGYLILSPLRGRLLWLYIAGAILATAFEYAVGRLMIYFLGDLWWDYKDKPFNFQGIICLESTLAWGLYAVIIVTFLHEIVWGLVDRIHMGLGVRLISLVLMIVLIDYCIQLMRVFHVDLKSLLGRMHSRIQSLVSRWS